MAPTLTVHEGDAQRTFAPKAREPMTGCDLIGEGCEMLAQWLEQRIAEVPPLDASMVKMVITDLRILAVAKGAS